MKKIIYLFFLIILLYCVNAESDVNYFTRNINFDTGICSENDKMIIHPKENEIGGTFSDISITYGRSMHIKSDSIKVDSSEGPLKFSLINLSGYYTVSLLPFYLGFLNGTTFYEFSVDFDCITSKKDWSLIRLPIIRGGDYPINFTLRLNRRLGYNKDGYIFLLGLPFDYTPYMDFSEVKLLSENPIVVNFRSKQRESGFHVLVAFVDLYYLSLPRLKIEQKDTLNLKNEKLDRKISGRNLHKDAIFYRMEGNKINIFYSNEDIVEGLEIIPTRGEFKYEFEDQDLNLIKKPCFYFSNNTYLFPFQCIDTEGTINITNYFTSNEDTLLVDLPYTLEYEEMDDLKIEESSRCISYNQITVPPMQVIEEVKQPGFIWKLPQITSSCENTRISILHDGVAHYISPVLINSATDFIKQENSFKNINLSINIPASSISINFKARLKNHLLSQITFYILLLFFILLFFVNIYIVSKKVKRNAKNKSRLLLYILSLLIGLLSELWGILQINPDHSIITLLTLTPVFGFIVGWSLFKLFESKYIKQRCDIYQYFPDSLK